MIIGKFVQVCNGRNEIVNGPAICFLVTDISPQASQTATTLDSHWRFLKDLWTKRELQLREQVLYATMDVVHSWTTEDFCSLNPANRQKIVEVHLTDCPPARLNALISIFRS